MGRRYAARIDENQPAIVDTLEKMGFSVALNHDDILVGKHGVTYWYEIKDPEKARSKKTGKILNSAKKDSQIKLEKEWRGHYKIVSSLEEILADVKKHNPTEYD